MINSKGRKYDGEWKNGVKHGHGYHQMNNGSEYKGQFQNGLKSGLGQLVLPDDAIYEGEWSNDMISFCVKMERACSHGQMVVGTRVNLLIICSMEKESTLGQTVSVTSENTKKTKRTAMAS